MSDNAPDEPFEEGTSFSSNQPLYADAPRELQLLANDLLRATYPTEVAGHIVQAVAHLHELILDCGHGIDRDWMADLKFLGVALDARRRGDDA